VDALDAANVALLAVRGEFLVAAAVSWLISLGICIRGETIRAAHDGLERLRERCLPEFAHACDAERTRQALSILEGAPLTGTSIQAGSTAAASAAAPGLTALGLVLLVLRRDAASLVGVLKTRADFAFGQSFATPAALLNVMATEVRDGLIFTSGRAIERLARVDAVILDLDGIDVPDRDRLLRALDELGVRLLDVPAERRVGAAVLADGSVQGSDRGGPGVRLPRQGSTVAVAHRAVGFRASWPAADVRAAIGRDMGVVGDEVDVLLPDGDPVRLAHAIERARGTMAVLRRTTAIACGSSVLNLVLTVLGAAPAPLPSLINTTSIGIVGWVAGRPARRSLQEIPGR
jgi:hypothetical protein